MVPLPPSPAPSLQPFILSGSDRWKAAAILEQLANSDITPQGQRICLSAARHLLSNDPLTVKTSPHYRNSRQRDFVKAWIKNLK